MILFRAVLLDVAFLGGAAEHQIGFDIEATSEHPRNSKGAFVTLKSGRLRFLDTQFYGGAHDTSPARIVAVHPEDGGATWSRKPRVVVENLGHENVMSISLLRLHGGAIGLFYLAKNS